ncbi:GIY-YIG nuclease family protein [bacterium]|nr:GIY-YIG nuclease family protein [bacterium]
MFYTYIARCNDNSLYTGYCQNLESREKKHNLGEGAKYTRSRRPVKIIYSEKFDTKSEAMKREWQIKKYSKKMKENLVSWACSSVG